MNKRFLPCLFLFLTMSSCIVIADRWPEYENYRLLKFGICDMISNQVVRVPEGSLFTLSNYRVYIVPVQYDQWHTTGIDTTGDINWHFTNCYYDPDYQLCLSNDKIFMGLINGMNIKNDLFYQGNISDFINRDPYDFLTIGNVNYPVYIHDYEPGTFSFVAPGDLGNYHFAAWRFWESDSNRNLLNSNEKEIYDSATNLFGSYGVFLQTITNSIKILSNSFITNQSETILDVYIIVEYSGYLNSQLVLLNQTDSNQTGFRINQYIDCYPVSNSENIYYYHIIFDINQSNKTGSALYSGCSNAVVGALYLYDESYPDTNRFLVIGY